MENPDVFGKPIQKPDNIKHIRDIKIEFNGSIYQSDIIDNMAKKYLENINTIIKKEVKNDEWI